MNDFLRRASLGLIVFAAMTSTAQSRECSPDAGTLISAEGSVQVRGDGGWESAGTGDPLCDRDSIRTGANSRAAIQLLDDAVLRLDENTTLVLSNVAPEPEETSLLQLVFGAIQSFSRQPQELEVDTPYLNATIEGTEFALSVGASSTSLTVLEGTVAASNEYGQASVPGGGQVVAQQGSAPVAVAIAQPRDAVQWALHFPPIGVGEAASGDALAAQARSRAEAGRPDDAIAILQGAPVRSIDAELYLASLLLSVGQSEQAAASLNRVLAADPSNGTALAELAILDVVENRQKSALEKAERAVAASPGEAAPYVALSYAQQSLFMLEAARDTLLAGAEAVPESAAIHSRLAEIWLALGYRDRSMAAADRALGIDPQNTRAISMRGYAALTSYDTATAAEAFEQAIALDPSDPYPRLGLGLAKIRDGDIEDGRAEIDAAVALDSNRSLYRSYLGKGYFAEERNELAQTQWEIAKELDPNDPTPYLYDAIRLQTENRPGEALFALQESIERNDNRAVYRGKLQLDSDEAARGASLGRIYQDLGFLQLGQRAATNSIAVDPSNASAHRFLADTYRGQRRRELARVSELLRSQLLQDVNLNPVQPSMTETNLNLVSLGGPTDAGFNEFTSLFASDGTRFTATGQLGNDSTWGGEAGFALQHGMASISASAFEFRTDGFRSNGQAEHSVYDIFAQAALSPKLNLQFEARSRKSDFGDLALNFDPDFFDTGRTFEIDEASARVGARFSPNPNNDTLLSLIYFDRTFTENATDGPFSGTAVGDGDGWQGELQHIWRKDILSLTVGGKYSRFDDSRAVTIFFLGNPVFSTGRTPIDNEDLRLYAYGDINFELPSGMGDLTLTVGGTWTDFSQDDIGQDVSLDVNSFDPKLGVIYNPIDDLTLRAAYIETVKPGLATNRTIEPSQVAGFNQFYDDANGSESRLIGVGVDYKVNDWVFVGAEAIWRDLEVSSFVQPAPAAPFEVQTTDREERTYSAYISLLPHERLPVDIGVVYDTFESDSDPSTAEGLVPLQVDTFSIPVTVRYFDPSGFFAGVRGTYVNQDVEREGAAPNEGSSSFFNLDAQVGYRFPNQRGSVSLQASNLLDADFDYQDDSYREFSNVGATGPYFPSLSVLGRLTINF